MLKYLTKRILYGIIVLWGVITIVFILFNILPGDPARMMLGQRSDISTIETINKDLGRDKPMTTQYLNYINDLSPFSIHNSKDKKSYWYLDGSKYTSYKQMFRFGDDMILIAKAPYLRRSYQSKRNVSAIIDEAFPNTAILALTAITIALIIGIFIGMICAKHKDSLFDKAALVLSVTGMSVPSFFAAIIIAWLFAFVLADYTGLNMFGSLYSVDALGRGEYIEMKNLILPALTLGIRPLAIVIELTRSSLLEVYSQDFIRTARAKGLPENKVIYRHALRNAMNPVITAITGWFASLMAGAVFVEYVFDWKGIGVVIVDGLDKYDFPIVMGCVLFISVILIIINIFVDIVYAVLDPRVKL